MRKFYVLNIEKGPEDPNNGKKVIRDPEGQGGEHMRPHIRSSGSSEVRHEDPALNLKLCPYLLLKQHMICTFL